MSCSPPSSGVFNGGTVTQPITITPNAASALPALVINLPTGSAALGSEVIEVNRENSGQVFTLDPYGFLRLNADTVNVANGGGAVVLKDSTGTVRHNLEADNGTGAARLLIDSDPASGDLGLSLDGPHAAPADAALTAGRVALWFDQTNGVGNTKLMVKGKSADGTVKTASIVIA